MRHKCTRSECPLHYLMKLPQVIASLEAPGHETITNNYGYPAHHPPNPSWITFSLVYANHHRFMVAYKPPWDSPISLRANGEGFIYDAHQNTNEALSHHTGAHTHTQTCTHTHTHTHTLTHTTSLLSTAKWIHISRLRIKADRAKIKVIISFKWGGLLKVVQAFNLRLWRAVRESHRNWSDPSASGRQNPLSADQPATGELSD